MIGRSDTSALAVRNSEGRIYRQPYLKGDDAALTSCDSRRFAVLVQSIEYRLEPYEPQESRHPLRCDWIAVPAKTTAYSERHVLMRETFPPIG